jgi:hypothetical protein
MTAVSSLANGISAATAVAAPGPGSRLGSLGSMRVIVSPELANGWDVLPATAHSFRGWSSGGSGLLDNAASGGTSPPSSHLSCTPPSSWKRPPLDAAAPAGPS